MTEKKWNASLTLAEAKSIGMDLAKKNNSNQLRKKLGLTIPVRENMTATLNEARSQIKSGKLTKEALMEAIKKAGK